MKSKQLILIVAALSCAAFVAKVRAQLPNAWQVTDASTSGALSYTNTLPSPLQVAATNAGFDFSVNARFLTNFGGTKAMTMIYGLGSRRFLIWWNQDANGDLTAELEGGSTYTLTTNGTGATLYHTHEIVYDAVTGKASYLFDGVALTTNWAGSATAWPAGEITWGSRSGSGQGQMNFHNVSFTVTNGIVASYSAGTEPTDAPDPESQGWSLSPSSPPSGTSTNAISPDVVPLPASPTATTMDATIQSPHQATLFGVVNQGNLATTTWFEWGTDTNYGSVTSPLVLLSDTNDFSLSQTITGLVAGTEYHFRCVATNAEGSAYGVDGVFTTPSSFVVTNLADSGPGSLRDRISIAQSGDMITFATNGTLSLIRGQLVIGKDLTISGPGPNSLAVSGNNISRVFLISSGVTASISSLTLEQGHAPNGSAGNPGGDGYDGGGIYNSGTLTLSNCVIANNTAGDGGNGSVGADGTLTSQNGDPGGNGGNGGNGGGIYNGNSLTLIACVLTNNAAGKGGKGGKGGNGYGGQFSAGTGGNGGSGHPGGGGGSIYNNGFMVCSNCIMSGNFAGDGGVGADGGWGGYIQSQSYRDFGGNGGNGGNAGRGGLAFNGVSAAGLTMIACTFSANHTGIEGAGGAGGTNNGTDGNPGTGGYGGAIINYQAALTTISGSTFVGNAAQTGSASYPSYGGVFYNAPGAGTVMINNSTFLANFAVDGGAVYNASTAGIFTLINCTLTGNSALSGLGGGIYNTAAGTLVLTNSIVAGNSATAGRNIQGIFSGANDLLAYNVPLLAPLGDYGGPTQTMPPLDGSPVIDAGDDSVTNFLAFDQRGYPRMSGAHVDIGAVEAQQSVVVNTNDSGAGSLRQVVAETSPAAIITFANNLSGTTIHLTSGQLTITNNNLGIDASSLARSIMIEAGGNSRILEISSNRSVILNSLTLANGNAMANGGGILLDGGAELTINNATLDGNTAGYGGGAIMVETGGSLTVNNSTLSGNSVPALGGGIYNNGAVTLNNSTVFGNSASALGGGIYNIGTFTLINSTLTGNSVPAPGGVGGGIYNVATLALTNTIVAGNTASSSSDVFGSFTGTKNFINGIPLLAPLGNYGGPTQTMPPLAGSPAIDAGDDSVASFLTTDQRGYPRKSGAHVDTGAVEAQLAPADNPPLLMNAASSGVGGNHSFQFTFTNVPDADFTVLASTNVALPLASWIPIGNAAQNPPGQYQFTDSSETNSQRFYRVVSP